MTPSTVSLVRFKSLGPIAAVLPLLLLSAGCAGSSPAQADVSRELTGGNGPFVAAANGVSVPDGYELHEYEASGVATAYSAGETGVLSDDGLWELTPTTTAEYHTRIVVRRPTDRAAASGTVIVEWLNVSGGVDADPEYQTLLEEVVRQGHTWVGVSAQFLGIEGGAVLVSTGLQDDLAGAGLKVIDPERYGALVHPGDGYSFDIFT